MYNFLLRVNKKRTINFQFVSLLNYIVGIIIVFLLCLIESVFYDDFDRKGFLSIKVEYQSSPKWGYGGQKIGNSIMDKIQGG